MIVDFNHFSFTVENLDKSIEFYKCVLGLEFISRAKREVEFSQAVTGVIGASLDIGYFKLPNCTLELIEYKTAKGTKLDTTTSNTGSAHICFNVKDFDIFAKKLLKNGVRFRGEIKEIPKGPNKGRKVAYIEDIDNNPIELISC